MDEICCSIAEFEKNAMKILEADVADYYQGGATSEQTLRNNRKAFSVLRLRPRVMRNVSDRDSSLTVLGRRYRCPVGISPTAMQKLANGEGEVAMAKAAGMMDAVMILSILSTSSLEEVRQANPQTTLWMQLYIFKERNITLDLVRRAEAAGYGALVLTMDTAVLGSRYRDLRNKFAMPPYLTLENFRNIKQYNEDLSKFNTTPGECMTGLTDYVSTQFDDSVDWTDVEWLIKSTKLPVICKGILTGVDALLCYKVGAMGIIVSNHGGRQLDQTPATIEALPEVVAAVGDKLEVYMDGGIRYGTDIFKAVGLGAKYVFVGRAALYGLAYSGWNGVAKVLQILNFEFDQTLALCGCTSAAEITRDMIVHQKYYEDLLISSNTLIKPYAQPRSRNEKLQTNQKKTSKQEENQCQEKSNHNSCRSQRTKKKALNSKISCKQSPKQKLCYVYKKTPESSVQRNNISPHLENCYIYKRTPQGKQVSSREKGNKNSPQVKKYNKKKSEKKNNTKWSRNCTETSSVQGDNTKRSNSYCEKPPLEQECRSKMYKKHSENPPAQHDCLKKSNKYNSNPPEQYDCTKKSNKFSKNPSHQEIYKTKFTYKENESSPERQDCTKKSNKYSEKSPEILDSGNRHCMCSEINSKQLTRIMGFCNSTCTACTDQENSCKCTENRVQFERSNEMCCECNESYTEEKCDAGSDRNTEKLTEVCTCNGSCSDYTENLSDHYVSTDIRNVQVSSQYPRSKFTRDILKKS